MKKSQLENRVTLVTIALIFTILFLTVWVFHAVQVDWNGFCYRGEINHALDLNKSIGTNADDEQTHRIAMQNDEFWMLRLAASLPFWGRLLITGTLVLLSYGLLRYLVRLLLTIQDQQQKHRRHRRHQ